jgi:hypothetical protein
MVLTPGVQRSECRLVRIMLNRAVVKFVPLVKWKKSKWEWPGDVVLFRPRIAKGKNGTAVVAGETKLIYKLPFRLP